MAKAAKRITASSRALKTITQEGCPSKLSLDARELMFRLIEAVTGEQRPAGKTASQLASTMMDDETREFYTALADTAMLYFLERLEAGHPYTPKAVEGTRCTLH
jgi:hypothetical protein